MLYRKSSWQDSRKKVERSCPDDGAEMVYYERGEFVDVSTNVLRLPAPCDLYICPVCEVFYPVVESEEQS